MSHHHPPPIYFVKCKHAKPSCWAQVCCSQLCYCEFSELAMSLTTAQCMTPPAHTAHHVTLPPWLSHWGPKTSSLHVIEPCPTLVSCLIEGCAMRSLSTHSLCGSNSLIIQCSPITHPTVSLLSMLCCWPTQHPHQSPSLQKIKFMTLGTGMHLWSELGNYHLLIDERGYYRCNFLICELSQECVWTG